MDGLVPAAFVGGLVAILSAHLRLRVLPSDEHVSHAQRDLVDLSLAEMVGAQVVSFQKLGRRQSSNANPQGRCIKEGHGLLLSRTFLYALMTVLM